MPQMYCKVCHIQINTHHKYCEECGWPLQADNTVVRVEGASDPNKIALIIGVDEYCHRDSLPSLPSCRKDAEDLSQILRKLGYTIFQNSPIIGSDLDREYGYTLVHKAIRDFFDKAQPAQTLLFYFSGHGIPREDEIYLATPQVEPDNPIVEGYPVSNLAKLMKSSKSKRIVSIIDACHSGAAKLPDSDLTPKAREMVGVEEAGIALATYDRMLDNVPKGEGRYFLLSSQAYQSSFALSNDNSIYTKYLIEGLLGVKPTRDENGAEIPGSVRNDGAITPESLHEYVYFKVASRMSQIPKLKVDKSSTIILARHPKLAEQLSEPMEIEQEFREVPPSQNVSLVIGIDIWLDENGKQIACYPSAKKNCLGICEALKDLGYGIFGNRPVLASEIHKQYGYMTIQTIMSTFFKKINSTQSAIFYFCGPMLTKDGILCTAQTRLFNPEIGGIQMQYLQSLLKFSMARQTLFVFDGFLSSIYSGKGRDYEIGSPWEVGKIPDSYQVTMTTFYEKLQRLVLPKGIVSSTGALPRQSYGLIAFAESSDPGQESLTVSTKTLIEALKPKNADNMGKITLDSIWKYIEFNLNAAAHHRSFALFDKNRELVIAQSE